MFSTCLILYYLGNINQRKFLIFITENIRIILTGIGVCAAIFSVTNFTASKLQVEYSERVNFSAKSFQESFFFQKDYHCNFKLSKTDLSPKNFEQISKEFKINCDFLKGLSEKFTILDTDKIADQWEILKFPISCTVCNQSKLTLDTKAKDLKGQLSMLNKYAKMTKRDELDLILLVYSPWLIAIVTAFSGFKLYAEFLFNKRN